MAAVVSGAMVAVVVGLAVLTATLLGGEDPTDAALPTVASSSDPSRSAPTGASDPSPAPATAPSTAPSTAPDPAEEPGPAAAVLPGDPVPGPGTASAGGAGGAGAPGRAGDGVVPASLTVPAIDVDVPLIDLGLQPDGSIEVPADAAEAGWLTASAVPGRTGPAVLAGHVDSATGEAVFTRLGELAAGDEVEVGLSDGTSVRYVVTGSERYPKDAFPSAAVYGPAPASVLRLLTCGGRFDRAEGSYEDNLVVYAVPAA